MRIDHVNIVVSDLGESTRFFELLGFEVVKADDLEGQWITDIVGLPDVKARYAALRLPDDPMVLELIQYFSPEGSCDPLIGNANQIGFRHMAFQVDNIDAMVERLQSKDVEFLSDVQTYSATGKRLVYFKGPDGVLLEFAEYQDN